MHTFKGESCRIHYNSDMSGEIIISNSTTNAQITVKFADLVKFVNDALLKESERLKEY